MVKCSSGLDQKLKDLSSKLSGRSLVWLGHQPPTLTTRVQIPATALNRLFTAESMLFTELSVKNCVINCFKWFSKVFERLNPNSFDFSTNSLSKYKHNISFLSHCIRIRGHARESSMLYVCWFSNFLISNFLKWRRK